MDPAARHRLDRLFAAQLGHATRSQMQEAGVSPATIRRWRAGGRLLLLGRHTFRRPDVGETDEGWLLAGCLDVDGVASHRSALWLLGLGRPRQTLEVVVSKRPNRQPSRSRLGGRDLVVHTSTNLPSTDLVTVRGVPSTNVARTLLSVAALVPRELSQRGLVSVVGRALDREQATLPWLWWMLERRRCRGRNGVGAFEAALVELDDLGPAESWLEREFVRAVRRHRLPMPRLQHVVEREGRFVARVDFCFDAGRLVVEVLGHTYHRTKSQLSADSARANDLQLSGWRLLQFTYDQVVHEQARTMDILRTALDQHSPSDPSWH